VTRKATPDLLSDGLRANVADTSLDVMFGPPADGERIVQIALRDLDDNPFQHRSAGIADDDPSLVELSTDIAQHGIHQPLIVRLHPDRDAHLGEYQIAAGHRRKLAADLAGLDTVPCVVRHLNDDTMLDVVFAENYHRTDINPIDRAQLMQLLADRGLTHQEIADRFSLSRSHVSNALRLLRLPQVIQHSLFAGEINQRQAEAILPLAILPVEARRKLNSYSNLESMVERAKRGDPSDSIRTHVAGAVSVATNELPDHWRNFDFGALNGVEQSKCAGCPRVIRHADTDRCTMPPCWDAKSSMWQAIEHAQIVKITGCEILPEETRYEDRTTIYDHQRQLLGLPLNADAPASHQCPNLRVKKGYRDTWEWVCYHPGKKGCQCVEKAEKAASKSGRDAWKEIRTLTEQALTGHLATFPLDALRLLASDYGTWEKRKQVHGWNAEECVPVVVTSLVKRHMPYDAEKNTDNARTQMTNLLTLAGVRAPWLPPLEEEIAQQLGAARAWLDDFLDPGDGTPTPDAMTAFLDELRGLADTISLRVAEDQRQRLMQHQTSLWFEALALQDRIQQSYELSPTL
jgi:ParB/RepB/Spo0J family partition protein